MSSEPAIAPPVSPVAGIDPPSVQSATGAVTRPPRSTATPRGSAPVRLARKMMGVLRGDKYLVGAYPPEWTASSMPDTAAQTDTTAADATSAARPKVR